MINDKEKDNENDDNLDEKSEMIQKNKVFVNKTSNNMKLYIAALLCILAIFFAKKYIDGPRISYGIDFGSSQSCVSSYDPVNKKSTDLFCSNSTIPKSAIQKNYKIKDEISFQNVCQDDIDSCFMYPKFFLSKSPFSSTLEELMDIKIDGFPLESIISSFFKYLKHHSELFLNNVSLHKPFIKQQIQKVVLSVPVEYSKAKVDFLKNCANKAGLDVLRVIVEPTAAALGYGLYSNNNETKHQNDHPNDFVLQENILVFDFGSGTLDISFTMKDENMFTTMKNTGIVDFGGSNFTKCLADNLRENFDQFKNINEKDLFEKAEKIKIKACNSNNQMYHFFVEKCNYLYDNIYGPLDNLIEKTGLSKTQFNYIVMTGGASLMPESVKFLRKYFGDEVLIFHDNPITAVASGNSIMASVIIDNSPVIFSAQDFTNHIN